MVAFSLLNNNQWFGVGLAHLPRDYADEFGLPKHRVRWGLPLTLERMTHFDPDTWLPLSDALCKSVLEHEVGKIRPKT